MMEVTEIIPRRQSPRPQRPRRSSRACHRNQLANVGGAHGQLVARENVPLAHLFLEGRAAAQQHVEQSLAVNGLVRNADEVTVGPRGNASAVLGGSLPSHSPHRPPTRAHAQGSGERGGSRSWGQRGRSGLDVEAKDRGVTWRRGLVGLQGRQVLFPTAHKAASQDQSKAEHSGGVGGGRGWQTGGEAVLTRLVRRRWRRTGRRRRRRRGRRPAEQVVQHGRRRAATILLAPTVQNELVLGARGQGRPHGPGRSRAAPRNLEERGLRAGRRDHEERIEGRHGRQLMERRGWRR